MTLEILSRLPKERTTHAPLLFVHGAYTGAWCWDEYFLPYFAERGFEAHAVSLRGHGASPVQPSAISHWQCSTKRSASGPPSSPYGVRTGAMTPEKLGFFGMGVALARFADVLKPASGCRVA